MRNLLCLATIFALFAGAPTPTAEACGVYSSIRDTAPHTLAVSTHVIPAGEGRGRQRAFVLLGSDAPADVEWKQLAPRSYDPTEIASAPAGAPMTLTLVGPRGTRVVTSARYVYLQRTFQMPSTSSLAVELDLRASERFELALVGNHASATWQALATRPATKADARWMKARGFGAVEGGTVAATRRGGIEVLAAWDDRARAVVSVVRNGDAELERHTGWAQGVLQVAGRKYIAIRHARAMRLVAI